LLAFPNWVASTDVKSQPWQESHHSTVRAGRGAAQARSSAAAMRVGEALGCYDRAYEKDPNYAVALIAKGSMLQRMGELEKAAEVFDQATKLAPRNKQAWVSKGQVLSWLNREEQAIECYDRALSIAELENQPSTPDTLWAWNNKGWSLIQLDQRTKALECFDKAIAINQNELVPWFNKATTLGEVGQYKEAIACMERAFSTVSDKKAAAIALAQIRSDYSDSAADHERAVEIARAAVGRSPANDPIVHPIQQLPNNGAANRLADEVASSPGSTPSVSVVNSDRGAQSKSHKAVAYEVQEGDTIEGIALHHSGSTVQSLQAANPQLRDVNRIYPGDTIFLPAGTALQPPPGNDLSGGLKRGRTEAPARSQ
jgi:tetratricopeptide (TPR) repeat protein